MLSSTIFKAFLLSTILHSLALTPLVYNPAKNETIQIEFINDNPKQIVDITNFNNFKPKETKFLSAKNNFSQSELLKTRIPIKSKGFDLIQNQKVASNSEYFELNQGNETILNTEEFLYFNYFLRIRNQLQGHWEYHIKKNLDRLVDHQKINKKAKVLFVLSEEGFLKNLKILIASGLDQLDLAAVDTINSAQPFPPPPEGLLKDSALKIHWEFILYY